MQAIDLQSKTPSIPTRTNGKAPYEYVLILGDNHKKVMSAIQEIYKKCSSSNMSSIIIGDGIARFDIFVALSILRDQIADGAMIDMWCHGAVEDNVHHSYFGQVGMPTKDILETLKIEVLKTLANAKDGSTQMFLSYYACSAGAILQDVPEGILTMLYGPHDRATRLRYNAHSVIRKLELRSAGMSHGAIIANELAKSAETKTLSYKTNGKRLVYHYNAHIAQPLFYDEFKKIVNIEIRAYQATFGDLITQAQAIRIDLQETDYKEYITECSHIASQTGTMSFFESQSAVDIYTPDLFKFTVKYYNNERMVELLGDKVTVCKSVIPTLVIREKYNLLNKYLTHFTIDEDFKKHLGWSVAKTGIKYYASGKTGTGTIAELRSFICNDIILRCKHLSLSPHYCAVAFLRVYDKHSECDIAQTFYSRLTDQQKTGFLELIFESAVAKGVNAWEIKMFNPLVQAFMYGSIHAKHLGASNMLHATDCMPRNALAKFILGSTMGSSVRL